MKIVIVGTGYVGLVTGTCLAESGNVVACVDVDREKIAILEKGGVPIYEPGLEELVRRNVREKRLSFSTTIDAAMDGADVAFIAVGTPPSENGEADLTHVLDAARAIGRAMKGYAVVVTKSTVPVGSSEKVAAALQEVTKEPFDVVSNPEFLKEGSAVDDFMRPDRVVIGTASERARAVMADLYAPFVRTENPVLLMDARSAELTKYAANAMLATRISFMNDIASLCERLGADVDHVRRGMGSDKRIGYGFLFPGVGFGGSCLAGGELVEVLRHGETRRLSLEQLFQEMAGREPAGADLCRAVDLSVLSWRPDARAPEFLPIAALTCRPFEGATVAITTEEERCLLATPDHPFIVRAGAGTELKPAAGLSPADFLPVARAGSDIAFERVAATGQKAYRGFVYSMEVPASHTFAATGGLVVHNCFPKDVRALMTMARQVGLDFDILRGVERVNERQKRALVEKAQKHYGQNLSGRTFGVWGLAFKPKTDDMREAPALTVIEGLVGAGAAVRAYDPVALPVAKGRLGGRVTLVPDPYAAADGADGLFLVTEWNEFRHPDFERLKRILRQAVLFDGRNVWDPAKLRAMGFAYYGIGRAPSAESII